MPRLSHWGLVSAGSIGLGYGIGSLSSGTIVLRNPWGELYDFHCSTAGVGPSIDLQGLGKMLGKAPLHAARRIDPGDLSGKTAGNDSTAYETIGDVIILDDTAPELEPGDFCGACLAAEAGGGLIKGYSGSCMVVGISTLWRAAVLAGSAANPGMILNLTDPLFRPKAMIVMRSGNIGLQAGAGITARIGKVWPESGYLESERERDERLYMQGVVSRNWSNVMNHRW